MKKWIATAAALLLVLALATPVIGAERDGSRSLPAWDLDVHSLVNWLATLWYDWVPAEQPETEDGEHPRAFIEGTGPYIVPVGPPTPNTDATQQLQTGLEGAESQDP